jgi:pyridoxal 5'-phosphate synthase pdxS subunit
MIEVRRDEGGNGPDGFDVKVGLARMLAGGVILDVTTADEARIAEDAGAVAAMALERVPADIRKDGGVARMASIERIEAIQRAVTIPVMAKVRIGHLAEARVLEALAVDFIDESEVLTPADAEHHVDKGGFRVPFVCGATCLGEALRRIAEGAALIRTKGEAGTGDVVEAVRHLRRIGRELRDLVASPAEELAARAKEHQAPLELVRRTHALGRLPVPNFAAGGIATPADAALVMTLGAEAVFVGSGVFKSADPARTAAAIVKAVARWNEPEIVLEACREAGAPMAGRSRDELVAAELLQTRGW